MSAEPMDVKPDPEAASDEDLDDAGDLEFYDQSTPGDPMGTMYLTRLPNYVWQAWADLDDDAEIQIGTIRQWNEVDANGAPQVSFSKATAHHERLLEPYLTVFFFVS